MISKIGLSLVASLCVMAWQATLTNAQEPSIPNDDGWTTLTVGQSLYGIHYEQNGEVRVDNRKVMNCPEGWTVAVSRRSLANNFVVIMSEYANESGEAYIVGTSSSGAVYPIISKSIREGSILDKWVNWSPDERFALLASGGEGFQGPMVLVNLDTGVVKEIDYKHLGLKGETEILDQKSVSWQSDKSFRMRFDVVCQVFDDRPRCKNGPCTGDCDQVIHRSYWARVNLSPFSISYTSMGETGSRRTKPKVSAPGSVRKSQPGSGIRSIDFRNFTYQTSTSFLLRESGAPSVQIRNGKFDNEALTLSVDKITYGDLDGDGNEDAFVWVSLYNKLAANPENEYMGEILVYTTKGSGVTALTEIDPFQLYRDYENYLHPNDKCDRGEFLRVRMGQPHGRQLLLTLTSGSRFCPDVSYRVTMTYRWMGDKLALVGKPIRRILRSAPNRR